MSLLIKFIIHTFMEIFVHVARITIISRKREIGMKRKRDPSKFFLLPCASEFRASMEHEKRFRWIINFILNEAAGTYVNAESVGYLHLR